MLIKHASVDNVTGQMDNISITAEFALSSQVATEQHEKLVQEIKRVAPRSDEFLYFTCRAITAAEAANYDEKGGIVRDGHFDKQGQWVCSDSNIIPYMNANGDVFPEEELKKAVGSFVGKGLFVNHSSDDVEKIRGIILDAVWVPEGKYIQVLAALDAVAHPALARQIKQGYSRDVSMGTSVQYSICSGCGNKAITEKDYCECVQHHKGQQKEGKKIYENNFGLSFIELSLVTTGADAEAKIKTIIAMLGERVEARQKEIEDYTSGKLKFTPEEFNGLKKALASLQNDVKSIENSESYIECTQDGCEVKEGSSYSYPPYTNIPEGTGYEGIDQGTSQTLDIETETARKKSKLRKQYLIELEEAKFQANVLQKKLFGLEQTVLNHNGGIKMSFKERDERRQIRFGYFLGTEEPQVYPKEDYQTIRDTQDKQMVGVGMESGTTGLDGQGYSAGPDLPIKEKLLRADENKPGRKTGMNKDQLEARRNERRAYFQGTEEPQVYPKEDYQTIRDTQDKQMVGVGMESGTTGLDGQGYSAGPDLPIKEKLQRAKLRARFIKAQNPADSNWTIFAGVEPILSATAGEIWGEQLLEEVESGKGTNFDYVASKEYGLDVIRSIRTEGLERTAYLLKGAQSLGLPPAGDDPTGIEDNLGLAEGEGELGLEEGQEEELTPEEQIAANIDQIQQLLSEVGELSGATVGGGEFEEELGIAGDDLGGANKEMTFMGSLKPEILIKQAEAVKDALKDAKDAIESAKVIVQKAKDYEPETGHGYDVGQLLNHNIHGEGTVVSTTQDTVDVNFGTSDEPVVKTLIASTGAEVTMEKIKRTAAKGCTCCGDSPCSCKDDCKCTKKGSPEWLLKRKAVRKVIAEQKYDINSAIEPQGVRLINEAHKDHLNKNIAPSGSGDGGVVENIIEQQQKDMEIATQKMPRGELTASDEPAKVVEGTEEDPKTIEAAKECDCCSDAPCSCKDDCKCKTKKADSETEVLEGAIEVEESSTERFANMGEEELRKLAEVDSEAKAYWKQFWGQIGPEGKKFADELTKEYAGESKTADVKEMKYRVKRAYELAHNMRDKTMIDDNTEAIDDQVETILGFSDDAFMAFKKSVENVKTPVKIGLLREASVNTPAVKVGQNEKRSLSEELNGFGWS